MSEHKSAKKQGKFKRIFFRIFGKARWFLLVILLYFVFHAIIIGTDKTGTKTNSVTSGFRKEEMQVSDIISASVNEDGIAALSFSRVDEFVDDEIFTLTDIVSKEQFIAGLPYATIDSGVTFPHDFEAGDGHSFYGRYVLYRSENEAMVTDEFIVGYQDGFASSEKLFHLKYDLSERVRHSQIGKLNYYNHELTFAVVSKTETRLYSIDTETENVRVSKPYLPDENGNYTTMVIPLDGSFLFLQTDGKVYQTGFDEPLKKCIYTVEAEEGNVKLENFFDCAAVSNGRIYVCRTDKDGKIYCLENGTLTEVLDLQNEEIISLDSFKKGNKDTLFIACKSGIYTYEGADAVRDDITVVLKSHFLVKLNMIMGIIFYLALFGLIINLIIRRKTLLYKQIVITLPVLLIPAIIVSVTIYSSIQDNNVEKTERDVKLVCKLATAAFEGYDFSGFEELGKGTGAASEKLNEMFAEFDTDRGDYVYSVIYVDDNGRATVLGTSDKVIQPLYFSEDFLTKEEMELAVTEEDYYLFSDVNHFLAKDSRDSSIYAYGLIHDASGCGRYLLRVQTDPWSFFVLRRDVFLNIAQYIILIAAALILITIITSVYISRTIKKATNTVEKIAEGDFSARIKYRSKDELGEICSRVNTMANSLEMMFDEKDKTEKFYYKFVPEKFREYLGKEKFTDLALGDAKSRDLTVLFFDIRAFSINSEIMTAKENFEFVNIIYGKAGPIIRKHNGFVDKYIGDAVMALFENADDAVLCGIELYREIVLNPDTAKAIGIGDINIGIGVHSGMARIGIVGEDERLSGTVISDTVNISSRMESLTKQFKTAMLVSKDTVDRMSDPDSLHLRYLGEVQVAGVNEVKALYEVLDCLDEEEQKKRMANISVFREAVRLFHLGRRREAAEMLQSLTESGMDDYVTNKYRAYISEMSAEDKGNVFRFVRK